MAQIGAAELIVGLHGAGLANVAFARRGVILLEFKGFYGVTDFVYRKFVQLVHGGFVAVRAAESQKAHFLTETQAASAAQCVAALQSGEAYPSRAARGWFT